MFDQIVANVCTVMALQNGCEQTFKAVGAQSQVSKDIDDTESYFVKHTTNEVYEMVGKKTVEYSIAAGFVANSISTKTIQFQTPLNIIPGDLKVNASPTGYNYSLNFKVNLP